MTGIVRIERLEIGDGGLVATLVADLPQWFARPEANAAYVAAAATMTNYVAVTPDGARVGVALVARPFPTSADVHLLAIARSWHRRGVGTAMLTAVEADLRAEGVRILTVKTLGPSDPDENYRHTRLFYQARGFVPVEELTGLWGDTPCLLMAKPLN
ncbi:MAG: GNAT family N-acetyltransferase [Micrococcales bacterium]|nr:GNAT family N-acetyltransferase [Micrococcales bacterium]